MAEWIEASWPGAVNIWNGRKALQVWTVAISYGCLGVSSGKIFDYGLNEYICVRLNRHACDAKQWTSRLRLQMPLRWFWEKSKKKNQICIYRSEGGFTNNSVVRCLLGRNLLAKLSMPWTSRTALEGGLLWSGGKLIFIFHCSRK